MRTLPILLAALPLCAQLPTCQTPRWTPCDLVFELQDSEDAAGVTLRAEVRSPRRDTLLIRAFASGRRLILRVAPTEAGAWDYRVTSSLARLDGQIGRFTATPSDAPGHVRTVNLHHFQTADLQPHLWMSTPIENFAAIPRPDFDEQLEARAAEKFTHIRVTIGADTDPDEAAARISAINARGLVADLVLSGTPAEPGPRERYLAEMVARFAAYNITWAGIPAFDTVPNGIGLARETGAKLAELDPYRHPITMLAAVTSSPLNDARWQTILTYGTPDPNVGAVEHQFYQLPAINTATTSRTALWQATMNGQYPAGGSGAAHAVWFDLMSQSRYWELEPYFDLDGGRALALTGVEYLVYVEKPGPVEMTVEDHGYDVLWINPATGERIPGKSYKGKRFVGEPPDNERDWVLRVSREGEKRSLLRTYKFESRRAAVQEIETRAAQTPFEIELPAGDLSLGRPPLYSLAVTRPSRATRDLLVLWTAEVPALRDGLHVAGTGRTGTLRLPEWYRDARLPGLLSLRVQILNAFGKAYSIDRAYRLGP
jgi:hypothetical protein